MTPPDEVLDVKGAAELLKCSRETVYRMARDGSIPFFRVGRNLRFRRRALLEWAAEQERATA